MKLLRLSDIDVRGKRVFIRADLNVPQDDAGNIADDTRIRACVPAIQDALARGAAVDPIAYQRNVVVKQFTETSRNRRERVVGLPLALRRPTEVRGHHDGGSARPCIMDCGNGCADARVVGDVPRVVLGNVQVRANEDALAAHVDVGESQQLHRRCAISPASTQWRRRAFDC